MPIIQFNLLCRIIARCRFTVCVLLACFWLQGSALAQTCSLGTLTASPQPAAIKVPTTLTAGQEFFFTSISATFSCTGSSGQGVQFFGPNHGTAYPVSGPTNVSVTNSNVGSSSITSSTGPCTVADQWSIPLIKFSSNGTCTGRVTIMVSFSATSAGSVSGTIPATMNVPGASDNNGWMSAVRCVAFVSGQSCSYSSPVTPLAVRNLASGIPITSIANTCTLVGAASRTITLPTVPLSAFSGVGSKAGQTLVNIGVNCPVAGAAALNFQLFFPGVLTGTTTLTSYIYNTASAPQAAGIAVAIADKNGTALTSGQTVQIASSVASGVNDIDLIVSYVQWKSSPTVGNVKGVATFAFTYN